MDSINWKNTLTVAAIEGLLVLVGVLLGFYFENLREEKEKLELLKRDLQVLSIEITENGEISPFAINFFHNEYLELDTLLDQIDSMTIEDLNAISIYDIHWEGSSENRLYALDMMINSGSFAYINNDTLILELTINYPFARKVMLENSEDINVNIGTLGNSDQKRFDSTKKVVKQLREKSRSIYMYTSKVMKIDSLIQMELVRKK